MYTSIRAGTAMYETLKLIYLADKCHLERYGRFIFGDWYVAMEYGPVPSGAYDVMKQARGDRQQSLAPHVVLAFRVDPATNVITALREADLDELSASDRECLDEVIDRYGKLGFGGLKDVSHDEAYKATLRNQQISIDAIAAMSDRAPDLIQHLADPHPDRA